MICGWRYYEIFPILYNWLIASNSIAHLMYTDKMKNEVEKEKKIKPSNLQRETKEYIS